MGLVVAGGQIISGSSAIYLPWDSTRSTNPAASTADNRGCAPGWATIYVQDSLTGDLVRVCRKLDESVLGPSAPQVIAEETGMDWYDDSISSIAEAAEDVVEAGGVIGGALTPFALSTGLLVGALALLVFMVKK